MGDRHRAARLSEQLRHRLADDVGAADDDRVQSCQVAKLMLEQHQAAERRAGHQRFEADGQASGIHRMEAVDVLVRVDARR